MSQGSKTNCFPSPYSTILDLHRLHTLIFNYHHQCSENGGLQGSKQVYVAGDDKEAREAVMGLIRAAGFSPVDTGLLASARKIEDIPVSVFQQWRLESRD